VRRGAFVALTFGRMLAKIAHAYASARLGPGNFKPFLVDLIRDTDTEFADRFVGGSIVDDPPIDRRHELDLYRERTSEGKEVFVVRIRLFADLGMTAFLVVVGEPL